jgi:hypothetical protein
MVEPQRMNLPEGYHLIIARGIGAGWRRTPRLNFPTARFRDVRTHVILLRARSGEIGNLGGRGLPLQRRIRQSSTDRRLLPFIPSFHRMTWPWQPFSPPEKRVASRWRVFRNGTRREPDSPIAFTTPRVVRVDEACSNAIAASAKLRRVCTPSRPSPGSANGARASFPTTR